jgi:hypothetical protein
MNRPPQAVFDLIALGTIRGIIIDYRQTGNDTAETFCEIIGYENRKISGKWHTYKSFLDVNVDWAAVARVQERYRKEAKAWDEFEEANKTELATYKRLKEKFEGVESP